MSRESPCWYDDRRGSLVYLTANELHSTRVRSRPKAEDILRYGQDPRVMKGVKTKVVPFRRIVRVIADSGLGRAEVRYSRGEAAKEDEKSKELRIPFHSKASGDSLLGRLGDRLGPSWTRLTSRRGKGRVAVLMWKPLLAAAVPWLVLIYLFRHVLASGCAMVVLAAVGVPVVVVLVRGVMRVVKAPTEVEELVPAAGGGAR